MAEWWESAPLAKAAPAASGGNWWESAPLVNAKPQSDPNSPEANSVMDYAMAVPTGITKGLMGLAAAPRELNDLAAKGMDWATGKPGHASLAADLGLPSYQDVKGGFESAVNTVGNKVLGTNNQVTMPEAQGSVPKMIEMGASFATPVPSGGAVNLPGTAARFAGGVASEGAGQLTEGTKYEVPVRVATGIGATVLANKGINSFQKGMASSQPRVAPNADDLREQASKAYKASEEAGGMLSPKVTNTFIAEASKKLKPQTPEGLKLAGKSEVSKIADDIAELTDQPLSLAAAQEIDEFLGDTIDRIGLHPNGAINKAGQKLIDLQSTFRRTIDDATPEGGGIIGNKDGFELLKEGRKLWSRAAKMRDIEKIITRAEMTDNPATAIKTGFKNLATNEKRMRGFTTEEVKAINKAANSGVITDILRVGGSRLIPMISGATGGFSGAVAGQAASMASRGAATALQVGKAQKAAEMIARGQAVPGMAEKAGMLTRDVGQKIPGLKSLFGAPGTTPPPMAPPSVGGTITGPAAGMSQSMAPQDAITRRPNILQDQSGSVTPKAAAAITGAAALGTIGASQIQSYLEKTRKAESGGVNNAQSPTSSAYGPFQFTRGTWQKMIEKYAPELGKRSDVQQLRSNPQLAEYMATKLAEENAGYLAKKEVPINDGSLYVAHFSGGPRAARMYIANPRAPATKFFAPFEIEANKSILKNKTIGQVIKILESKVS